MPVPVLDNKPSRRQEASPSARAGVSGVQWPGMGHSVRRPWASSLLHTDPTTGLCRVSLYDVDGASCDIPVPNEGVQAAGREPWPHPLWAHPGETGVFGVTSPKHSGGSKVAEPDWWTLGGSASVTHKGGGGGTGSLGLVDVRKCLELRLAGNSGSPYCFPGAT